MPKQTSRSWISLLRAFGVRGAEELPFPLDSGVKAVVDADRYDPNPHYLLASREGSQVGERGVLEISATVVTLWIPRVQVLTSTGQINIFTTMAVPTVAPGPGLGFTAINVQSSHGTAPRFSAVTFTRAGAVPAGGLNIDNPVDFGPFALRRGMQMQITHSNVATLLDAMAIVEEMGFE